MKRIHFKLSQGEDDYLIAASRIHEVVTVDIDKDPDAIVTDDSQFCFERKPVLLVNESPLHDEPWLFPALPWRFAPDVQAIANSLRAGKLGKPGLFRMHDWAPTNIDRKNIHKIAAVDLSRWLFEEDPNSVYGTCSSSGECSLIHLGFPGGGMAILDFTDSLPAGEGYRSLCLIGLKGGAYADDHRNRNLFFTGGAPEALPPDFERSFIQPMLEDFVARVQKGESSSKSNQDYRNAQEIVSIASACRKDP